MQKNSCIHRISYVLYIQSSLQIALDQFNHIDELTHSHLDWFEKAQCFIQMIGRVWWCVSRSMIVTITRTSLCHQRFMRMIVVDAVGQMHFTTVICTNTMALQIHIRFVMSIVWPTHTFWWWLTITVKISILIHVMCRWWRKIVLVFSFLPGNCIMMCIQIITCTSRIWKFVKDCLKELHCVCIQLQGTRMIWLIIWMRSVFTLIKIITAWKKSTSFCYLEWWSLCALTPMKLLIILHRFVLHQLALWRDIHLEKRQAGIQAMKLVTQKQT